MFKKLTGSIVLLLFAFTATATAQLNIGYMNTQEVLSQMPERADIQQQLNTFVQQKQQELQQRSSEFDQAVTQYQQEQSGMSQAEREQREQELSEMQAGLEQAQQMAQQQVQQKQSELLGPLFERIDQAIAVVAEENDLDFVLNETTNAGDNIVFYAAESTVDVTPLVIQQLGIQTPQN